MCRPALNHYELPKKMNVVQSLRLLNLGSSYSKVIKLENSIVAFLQLQLKLITKLHSICVLSFISS